LVYNMHQKIPISTEKSAYQFRGFHNGDEKKLVALFNRVYENYAGFVPRTPRFWLWCCKSRPGVRDDGIIIVEVKGEVTAYVVFSDSGEILEICYDRNYVSKKIIFELMEIIEENLRNYGTSSIILNAPMDDFLIREVCGKLGYVESKLPYALQISIIDLPELIREIIRSKTMNKGAQPKGNIILKIKQSSSKDGKPTTLKISDNQVQMEITGIENSDFLIEAETQVFTSCIFGNLDPRIGILTKKIKISPFWKVVDILAFLWMLKLDNHWYIPLSDFG